MSKVHSNVTTNPRKEEVMDITMHMFKYIDFTKPEGAELGEEFAQAYADSLQALAILALSTAMDTSKLKEMFDKCYAAAEKIVEESEGEETND